jgi:hypothetical protein
MGCRCNSQPRLAKSRGNSAPMADFLDYLGLPKVMQCHKEAPNEAIKIEYRAAHTNSYRTTMPATETALLLFSSIQTFRLSLPPSQAVLIHILVNFGRRSDLVTISVQRASRCYLIAVVATPNSLRCETAVFGSCAAQEYRANHNTGRGLYLHRVAHDLWSAISATIERVVRKIKTSNVRFARRSFHG